MGSCLAPGSSLWCHAGMSRCLGMKCTVCCIIVWSTLAPPSPCMWRPKNPAPRSGEAELGGDSARASSKQTSGISRCGLDSAKPAVDLESPPLVSRLFALFHGTPPSSSLAPPNRVAPASRSLQARLMALFCKSATAANCAPFAYQVCFRGRLVSRKVWGIRKACYFIRAAIVLVI